MILKYISGPLIGAVIGYFTNYLAVKMLFFPKNEVRIWGHRLPLTPGAIPKGKPRLARAIGEIVGKTLLTEKDITKQLLTDEMEEKLACKVTDFLSRDMKQEMLAITDSGEETYEQAKEKVAEVLCEQIMLSMEEMQLGVIIAKKGKKIVMEKIKGTMLEMFLSENRVASFIEPAGEAIQQYIQENGSFYIRPVLDKKLDGLGQASALELLEEIDMDSSRMESKVKSMYERTVNEGIGRMLASLNISKMIEDKINAMDMDELEDLVLAVMKKELDAIVNLGAVIGLLLGIINIFF